MFDVGGGELILILLAILVLFGPKKIPELAQMLGKGMQQFRKAQAQFQNQIDEIKTEITAPAKDLSENLSAMPAPSPIEYPKTELSEIKEKHQQELNSLKSNQDNVSDISNKVEDTSK